MNCEVEGIHNEKYSYIVSKKEILHFVANGSKDQAMKSVPCCQ